MIEIKLLDNKCLENIMNDFINSAAQVSDLQAQLSDEEDYRKLTALADSLKETMAGCPEADLMEAFEDAVYWKSAYETSVAYLDGIRKGFNLRRFIIGEKCPRQQSKTEETR